MKRFVLTTLAVCLATLGGAGPSMAQSRSSITLTLPHQTTFGVVSLPAGDCTITSLSNNGREASFAVHSDSGPSLLIRMERAVKFDTPDSTTSEVQLRRAGEGFEVEGFIIDGKAYRISQ